MWVHIHMIQVFVSYVRDPQPVEPVMWTAFVTIPAPCLLGTKLKDLPQASKVIGLQNIALSYKTIPQLVFIPDVIGELPQNFSLP